MLSESKLTFNANVGAENSLEKQSIQFTLPGDVLPTGVGTKNFKYCLSTANKVSLASESFN